MLAAVVLAIDETAKRFVLPHTDELVWNLVPRPHPELQLASVIALVDFTAENGATRVAPGSHQWDRDRLAEPDEVAVAEMPAGSAVVPRISATLIAGAL